MVGALDEGHFHLELENGVKMDMGIDQLPETTTLAIENAVRVLLQGLGENINREGIKKTPLRVAKALLFATKGYKQNAKEIIHSALFPEAGLDSAVGHAGGVGGLVLVRDLDLFSYCESCLLPIQVKCHVGYVPTGQKVVGLSKLSRVADVYAKRLQNPQRLANEICSALQQGIMPAGVAVFLHCLHINFPNLESLLLDSNHQGWVKATVHSGSGVFEDENSDAWSDFLSLLKLRGIDVSGMKDSSELCWCPSQSPSGAKFSSKIESLNPGMVSAAASIITSMGEDPLRKELVGTPSRFLKWLMNFQTTNLGMKLNGFGPGSLKVNGVSQNKEHMCSEVNLSLWSQCEHHLLPFYGVVHIGYFPAEGLNPIGKSLLQSIVHFYGFKLQVQERLTRQIAETVSSLLGEDVMVVVEANHTCMISRGIEKFGSSTATIAVLGRFASDSSARAKFLQSIPSSSSGGSLLH
ncbi:GTP cyclohydrolase 1 [Euphorbia peplus]|nr:GTP cyclohydrolase 1 [Euphorbia peplus]